MRLFRARGSIMAWQSDKTSSSDANSSGKGSVPDPICARSTISLMNSSKYPPACTIFNVLSFCLAVSGGDWASLFMRSETLHWRRRMRWRICLSWAWQDSMGDRGDSSEGQSTFQALPS